MDIINLVSLMQFILKTCWHYHRQFANWFLRTLKETFTKCVRSKGSPFQSKEMTMEHQEMIKEQYE